MNQPNYNFSYDAGGLVNYVWKNTVAQSNISSSNSGIGNSTSSSGQTNQYGNQQNKSLPGNNQNNLHPSNNGSNNTSEQKK